jgi:(2R)-3-sulfolactate dehydrogenase (NADP+)
MIETITLSKVQTRKLIHDALTGAGTTPGNAPYFTDAILDTELSGLEGHGLYWLQYYCEHLLSGKVDGASKPKIRKLSPVAFHVDAMGGFAHPAIELGFGRLVPAAKKFGIAALGVGKSYNAATLGFHTGHLAKQGLLAFGFTNSTPSIAPFGGTEKVIGTNPLSVAIPGMRGKIAFLIDQSASAVPWTELQRAAERGAEIPLGWALDSDGQPTTDPKKRMAGSAAPAGGYKGFNQGLIVEIMCAALAGGNLGLHMGSFSANDGRPIGCGQFFIAIDPDRFGGAQFAKTVKALIRAVTSQKGARLPISRRAENQKRFAKSGITVEKRIVDRLKGFLSV